MSIENDLKDANVEPQQVSITQNISPAEEKPVEVDLAPVPEGSASRAEKRKNFLRSFRQNPIQVIRQSRLLSGALIFIVVALLVLGVLYGLDIQSKVYIEKSEIWAPVIALGPTTGGEIDEIYVKEGEKVFEDQQLAKVGGHLIKAKTSGIVTYVQNTPGQNTSSQSVIVKMFDPRSLRVVGHIEEDKGLSDIRIGQRVNFTVDAFPSKQYIGTVETIGVTSRDSSIVFSISDKRQEKEFDVTASFDVNSYPELKNGMSAKMWIIK